LIDSKNYSSSDNKVRNLKLDITQKTKKKKSIALGTIMSAIIPGAGEFYGESYLKAGIFFGVELLAWGTFTYFTIKGDDKTEEFQNFADQHWSVRRYAQWLVDEWEASINPQEPNIEVLWAQVNAAEQTEGFSHTLPAFGTQQYYELIGKYQPYVAGWEDAYVNGAWQITQENYHDFQTNMFKSYAIDRQDANDQYDIAKIGPITAILNHILSAADAAWTISTYNKKIEVETGFRMDTYRSLYTNKLEMVPTFNMRVSF
jgi:hypothetical protein